MTQVSDLVKSSQRKMWNFLMPPSDFCTIAWVLYKPSHLFAFTPQVCRLPTESTYAPTPLLKLIHVWCKNARSGSTPSLSKKSRKSHSIVQNLDFRVRLRSFCFQVFSPLGQTKSGPAGVRRPPQRFCTPPSKERIPGDRRHGNGRSWVPRHHGGFCCLGNGDRVERQWRLLPSATRGQSGRCRLVLKWINSLIKKTKKTEFLD